MRQINRENPGVPRLEMARAAARGAHDGAQAPAAARSGEGRASAQYQDGVLSLTLPKKTPAEQKRLQIE